MRLPRAEQSKLHTEAARLVPSNDAGQARIFEAWQCADNRDVGAERRTVGGLDVHASEADVRSSRLEGIPVGKLDDNVQGNLDSGMLTLFSHGTFVGLGR